MEVLYFLLLEWLKDPLTVHYHPTARGYCLHSWGVPNLLRWYIGCISVNHCYSEIQKLLCDTLSHILLFLLVFWFSKTLYFHLALLPTSFHVGILHFCAFHVTLFNTCRAFSTSILSSCLPRGTFKEVPWLYEKNPPILKSMISYRKIRTRYWQSLKCTK